MEQLGNDDYLGTCFATIGRRNYTFTAWTTPEAAQAALRGDAHGTAMKLAQTGGLGAGVRGVTSMWTPHFLNGVFHANGGSTSLADLGGQWSDLTSSLAAGLGCRRGARPCGRVRSWPSGRART